MSLDRCRLISSFESLRVLLSVPSSHAGYEPTSMRAIRARYNPYVQARGRVDQLRKLGHSVDKVRTPRALVRVQPSTPRHQAVAQVSH